MGLYKGMLWAALFSIPLWAALYFAFRGLMVVCHFVSGVI